MLCEHVYPQYICVCVCVCKNIYLVGEWHRGIDCALDCLSQFLDGVFARVSQIHRTYFNVNKEMFNP